MERNSDLKISSFSFEWPMVPYFFCPELRPVPQRPGTSLVAHETFKQAYDGLRFRSLAFGFSCYVFTGATAWTIRKRASPLVTTVLGVIAFVSVLVWYKWGVAFADLHNDLCAAVSDRRQQEAIAHINAGADIFQMTTPACFTQYPCFRLGMYKMRSRQNLLILVAQENCPEVMRHLLTIMRYENWVLFRALRWASSKEIVEILLEAGANLNWYEDNESEDNDRYDLRSILHHHLRMLRTRYRPIPRLEVIRFLLSKGAHFLDSEDPGTIVTQVLSEIPGDAHYASDAHLLLNEIREKFANL